MSLINIIFYHWLFYIFLTLVFLGLTIAKNLETEEANPEELGEISFFVAMTFMSAGFSFAGALLLGISGRGLKIFFSLGDLLISAALVFFEIAFFAVLFKKLLNRRIFNKSGL